MKQALLYERLATPVKGGEAYGKQALDFGSAFCCASDRYHFGSIILVHKRTLTARLAPERST